MSLIISYLENKKSLNIFKYSNHIFELLKDRLERFIVAIFKDNLF